MGLSEKLVYVHLFHDFFPDGYHILRVEDIEELERSESEQNWDRMLAGESLLDGLRSPPEIELTSMPDAIRSIAERYPQMIIECEAADEDTEGTDFYLGTLIRATEEVIEFEHYDALGVWAEQPATIWANEITRVQFDTPYANTFAKYAQPRPSRE